MSVPRSIVLAPSPGASPAVPLEVPIPSAASSSASSHRVAGDSSPVFYTCYINSSGNYNCVKGDAFVAGKISRIVSVPAFIPSFAHNLQHPILVLNLCLQLEET